MMPILKVENLSKDFVKSLDLVAKGLNKIGQNYKEEIVHAVDNVNFSIFKDFLEILNCIVYWWLSLACSAHNTEMPSVHEDTKWLN